MGGISQEMDEEIGKELKEHKEKLKEKYEKHRNEIKAIAVQLEGRLNHLQSSAFQLANLFFVFQGIIFAATGINGSMGLHCSLRWLPTTLSLLALFLNFIAFFAIIHKYNLTSEKLHESWSLCNEYQTKIENLNRIIQVIELENERPRRTLAPSNPWENFLVWLSLAIFLAFAIIMIVGYWKIPCSNKSRA